MTNNQDWIQLMLKATADDSEGLGEVLTELGAMAITFQDIGDEPIYEPLPGEHTLWSHTHVIGLFSPDTDTERLIQALQSRIGKAALFDYHIKKLADRDWERVWLEHFKPMQFAPKLWVCPTTAIPPDPQAINLMLDPGLAFGTGTHPTTALCLEALAEHQITHKNVLDFGCGSGILAIAAARLGATSVWAVDIDRQALLATQANAQRNHVTEKITTGLPDDLPQTESFDIILANILSGPLIKLATTFTTRICAGGTLILSGILAEQANTVIERYSTNFTIAPPRQREEWVCLVATRQ